MFDSPLAIATLDDEASAWYWTSVDSSDSFWFVWSTSESGNSLYGEGVHNVHIPR